MNPTHWNNIEVKCEGTPNTEAVEVLHESVHEFGIETLSDALKAVDGIVTPSEYCARKLQMSLSEQVTHERVVERILEEVKA